MIPLKIPLKRASIFLFFPQSFGKCFVHPFNKGLKYALLLLACAFLSGALYGLISGVTTQPALFTVLYTDISIGVNFVIALFAFAFTGIFLAPFRKGGKSVYEYFALSIALLVVFLPVIVAMGKWCTDLF